MLHVHRLQSSNRIFFVTVNVCCGLVPLAEVGLRFAKKALAASSAIMLFNVRGSFLRASAGVRGRDSTRATAPKSKAADIRKHDRATKLSAHHLAGGSGHQVDRSKLVEPRATRAGRCGNIGLGTAWSATKRDLGGVLRPRHNDHFVATSSMHLNSVRKGLASRPPEKPTIQKAYVGYQLPT